MLDGSDRSWGAGDLRVQLVFPWMKYMSRCETISPLWRDRTFTVAWSVMVWTSSKTISKKYQCKMRSSRITKSDMSISILQNWISLARSYTYLSGSIWSVSTPTLSFTNEWRRRSLEVFSKRWSRIFPSESKRFLPIMARNSHMNALPNIYDLKGKRISSIEPAKLMASGINWRNLGIIGPTGRRRLSTRPSSCTRQRPITTTASKNSWSI